MKSEEVREVKQKIATKCECGYAISGISEAHIKSQLRQHRKSVNHKRAMAINQSIASGSIAISKNHKEDKQEEGDNKG